MVLTAATVVGQHAAPRRPRSASIRPSSSSSTCASAPGGCSRRCWPSASCSGPTVTVALFGVLVVLGVARVHHAHADADRRSPHAVLGVLRLHAAAVLPRRRRTNTKSTASSFRCTRFSSSRPASRWRAISNATSNARTTIQTGLMICVYCLSYAPALLSLKFPLTDVQPVRLLLFFFIIVALERRVSLRLRKAAGQTPDRPGDQPEQNLGRLPRRARLREPRRAWPSIGPARSSAPQAAMMAGADLGDGLLRRPDDVGDQARPRRERLRHAPRRPLRRARPNRFDLLRRAGVLPRHEVSGDVWADVEKTERPETGDRRTERLVPRDFRNIKLGSTPTSWLSMSTERRRRFRRREQLRDYVAGSPISCRASLPTSRKASSRTSDADFLRFLEIALGSLRETECFSDAARRTSSTSQKRSTPSCRSTGRNRSYTQRAHRRNSQQIAIRRRDIQPLIVLIRRLRSPTPVSSLRSRSTGLDHAAPAPLRIRSPAPAASSQRADE